MPGQAHQVFDAALGATLNAGLQYRDGPSIRQAARRSDAGSVSIGAGATGSRWIKKSLAGVGKGRGAGRTWIWFCLAVLASAQDSA